MNLRVLVTFNAIYPAIDKKIVILSGKTIISGKSMTERKQNLRDSLSAREKAAITRDLFERYRNGNTTREENDLIESLADEIIPKREFEVTDALIKELDSETKDFIFERTGVKIESGTPVGRKRVFSPALIGAIAAIALLVIGIFIVYQKRSPQESLPPDLTTAPISRQYVSGKDIENITLPDGSRVSLNTGTTLTLREGSMDATRQVWLKEGEAFFDVKEDKTKPFTVHLREGVTVQVMGTSFTIQSYKELAFQEISVVSGKVKVETTGGEGLELLPDQKATYLESEKTLARSNEKSALRAAWRTGTIVLENASMDELCFRVRQFYGKEMVFEHTPETMSVNISFDRNTSADEISTEIAALYGLSYRIIDDQIIFSEKGS